MQVYVKSFTWLTMIPEVIGVSMSAYLLSVLILECGPPNTISTMCQDNGTEIVVFLAAILPALIAISFLIKPKRLSEMSITATCKNDGSISPVVTITDYKSGKQRSVRVRKFSMSKTEYGRMTIWTGPFSAIFVTSDNEDNLLRLNNDLLTKNN